MFYSIVSIWRMTTTITGRNALTVITGEMLATSCISRKVVQLSCHLFCVNLHTFYSENSPTATSFVLTYTYSTVKTAQLPPLWAFTLCLIVSCADNLCKQLGPRSGQIKRRACSGSNMFYTQMVFLKEFCKNK